MQSFNTTLNKILKNYKISEADFLGEGDEAIVYKLNTLEVLKIYRSKIDLSVIKSLQNFYKSLSLKMTNICFPQIYEIYQTNKVVFTIEKYLQGQTINKFIEKNKVFNLEEVYNSIKLELSKQDCINYPYGDILSYNNSITTGTWKSYILNKLKSKEYLFPRFSKALPHFNDKITSLTNAIVNKVPENINKTVIHGDITTRNILYDKENNIISLIDFGKLSIIGDKDYEIASLLLWTEVDTNLSNGLKKLLQDNFYKESNIHRKALIDLYRPLIRIFSADYFDEEFFEEAVLELKKF